ncbi:Phage NinH protein [Serratia quinivorans]|nr:Phage NinH protein [Serratia quinivorans]
MSEVARKLQCQRQAVANYARDFKAEFHCIVNGILMTKTKQKGSRA